MARTAATRRRSVVNIPYSVQLTDANGAYLDTPITYNPTGAFTLGLYLYPTEFGSDNIYSQADGSGTGRSWLFTQAGDNLFIRTLISGVSTLTNLQMTLNRWQMFFLTHNGSGSLKFYKGINDSLTLADTKSLTPSSATGIHRIGVSKLLVNPQNMYYTKHLFFSTELALAAIEDIYFDMRYSAALGEHLFTEGSGSSVANTGSAGGTATIQGTPTWTTNVPRKSRDNASARTTATLRETAV